MSRRSSYYYSRMGKYYPVGTDCVGYWAFWDGTATDHSTAGNDGVVTGASFGEFGLTFDGTDDLVNVGTMTEIESIANMTWYIWARVDSTDAVGPLMTKNDATAGNRMYIYPYGAGIEYYETSDGGDNTYFGSTSNGTQNAWQLWAYVYDGTQGTNATKCKMYWNNVQQTLNYEGTMPVLTGSGGDCCFAGYTGRNHLKCIIGEVLCFVSSKNTSEMTDYYNDTKARYGL